MLGAKSEGQIRLDLRLQGHTERRNESGVFPRRGNENHLLDLVPARGTSADEIRRAGGDERGAAEVAIALPSKSGKPRGLYSEGLVRLRAFDALRARDLLQNAIAVEPGYALSQRHCYRVGATRP